jgi:N-acetyl-gamma-glutamylphosphate reductase
MDGCNAFAQSQLVLAMLSGPCANTAQSKRLAFNATPGRYSTGLLTAPKPLMKEQPTQCDSFMVQLEEQ